MPNLLIVILHDINLLPELLHVWEEIGVPGTTIMKSAGGHSTRSWLSRVGLGSINHLFDAKEIQSRTLLAIIESEDLLAQAIAEAERVVGGFDQPYSGVLMVLPATQVRGLHAVSPSQLQEISPPALRPGWMVLRNTPIEEVEEILALEPTLVQPEASLNEVAQAMLAHPNVHVASVIAKDGRLIGLLSLRSLADDLFFHILPEEFIAESTDIEKMMDFADKTRILTAGDAMVPPVWVKRGETVKNAFKRMHEHGLPGLPVVDDSYQVVGYVNLLELLALCLETNQNTQSDENS